MKLTIGQFDAVQERAGLLRERLQQEPTHAEFGAGSVSFFRADVEIGHVNTNTGAAWVQKSGGGSEAVNL